MYSGDPDHESATDNDVGSSACKATRSSYPVATMVLLATLATLQAMSLGACRAAAKTAQSTARNGQL
jgi:hypothetical protein